MRRTTAGIAVSLLAALAIGGPLGVERATPLPPRCSARPATPPAACALLDDLAGQLGPIAPLLGAPLAPLTGSAQGLAARSDQPAGVPTAEVVEVSEALLEQLGRCSRAGRRPSSAPPASATLTDTLAGAGRRGHRAGHRRAAERRRSSKATPAQDRRPPSPVAAGGAS